MTTRTILAVAFAAAISIVTPALMAQDSSPTPAAADAASTPSREQRMEQFRQRMNDRLKTELSATDDEWSVIEPLLKKVQDAQFATMAGRFGGMRRMFGGGGGGGGGRGGPDGAPGGSPAAAPGGSGGGGGGGNRGGFRMSTPEVEALRDALASQDTSTDEIKTKLQALRDARKKQEADLETARENLKKVLTLRQEAILVEMGVLD